MTENATSTLAASGGVDTTQQAQHADKDYIVEVDPEQKPTSTSKLQDRKEFIDHRTAGSPVMAALREHPQTLETLPVSAISNGAKQYINWIYVSEGASGRGAIYYLYGDERRAARLFIERYPEVTHTAMHNPSSRLRNRTDEYMFRIIAEEYQLGGYGDDSPEEVSSPKEDDRWLVPLP